MKKLISLLCVFAFVVNAYAGEATALPEDAMAQYPNEQSFAAAHASSVSFWPDGDVISFKRHLCHRYGLGLMRQPKAPPPTAKVVAFHGKPRPADTWERTIWGPAPHIHAGRVDWIEDYRRRYGDIPK